MLKYIGKNNKEMGDNIEEYSYKYKLDGFMIDDGAFKEDLGTVGKIAINNKENWSRPQWLSGNRKLESPLKRKRE